MMCDWWQVTDGEPATEAAEGDVCQVGRRLQNGESAFEGTGDDA